MLKKSEFAFRTTDRIGFAAAEQDQVFLVSCFVDNGQYEALVDGDLTNHIVLGRTGAGKTALLERISEQQVNSLRLDPEQLALNYLTNSTILRFLVDLDIDLDLFFGLLWRHVIVVEVIRSRYKIKDATTKQHFFAIFDTLFQSPKQKKALEYLDQWGSSFWLETEERIKEIASKLETDVRTAAGTHYPGLLAKLEAGAKITEEEKREYSDRFKTIVSQVQIQELANVIELLDDILDDPQNIYFMLVDHLDEKWVDDRYKTRLIRALLEATRRFLSVQNVRIVIALRFDLYDRVLADTRASQQQEEKIHSLCLSIKWSRDDLTRLLDARINRVVRQRYTRQAVTHEDVLPFDMPDGTKRKRTIQWILDRTFMRPRDVIQFFNFAISKAVDQPVISEAALLEAEGEYSRERLAAIADEYSVSYPNLITFSEVLFGRPERFALKSLNDMELLERVHNALGACNGIYDRLRQHGEEFAAGSKSLDEFRRDVFWIFYEVGIVGIQKAPGEPVSWTYETRRSLSRAEITEESRIYVHPMLWRRFGIRLGGESMFED
jgi:hypothetical protein